MLELTPLSIKERFWLPAAVAFVMHSLIISALTLGCGQGDKKYSPVVNVEIIFDQNNSAPEKTLLCEQAVSHTDGKEAPTVGLPFIVTETEVVPGVEQPVSVPLKFTVIVPVGENVNDEP